MRSEYDLIVIGAGPAGAIAARTAAQSGLGVLLIEKRQEVGEPVRCAEAVQAEQLTGFIDIDPRWVCANITGARIHMPDGNMLSFSQGKSNEVAGMVLDRKLFDRALVRTAAEAGAEVRVKTQATSLIIENGLVTGIKGFSYGDPFEAISKIVIGSDGVESKVGRWAGIIGSLKLNNIGSCVQFYLTNVDIDPSVCEFYIGSDIAPGGYVWIFPKGPNEANIGLGIIASRIGEIRPIDYLQQFVDRRFPDGRILQTIVGAIPICDAPKRLSTGGLMLAGDGGRLVDPLLGAGIINAMESGMIAAKVACDSINRGDISATALKRYDAEIDKRIGNALRRNYRIKELLANASDRQVNSLARYVQMANVQKVPISILFNTVTYSGLSIKGVIKVLL